MYSCIDIFEFKHLLAMIIIISFIIVLFIFAQIYFLKIYKVSKVTYTLLDDLKVLQYFWSTIKIEETKNSRSGNSTH